MVYIEAISEVIEITGRVGVNSIINGKYSKASTLYNRHSFYTSIDQNHYIYYLPQLKRWNLYRSLGNRKCYAFLKDDINPTVSTKDWYVFNGKSRKCVKDENIRCTSITVIKKILNIFTKLLYLDNFYTSDYVLYLKFR